MVTKEYSEAVVEVLDILKHTKKEDLEKIPKKVISFFETVKSDSYISKIDHSKKLSDNVLRPKTKDIIAMLYRNYWCPIEERADFDNLLKSNYEKKQKELREKYPINNIFDNEDNTIKNQALIEYKESRFKKIINWIKRIFLNR